MSGMRRSSTGSAGAVLLVEDDDDVREIIVEILQNHRFEVAAANDGREAIDWITRAARLPDVVILDVMMPTLDGAGFLAEARLLPGFEAVPVVVISAGGPRSDEIIPREAVSAWLRKPFDFDDLLGAVNGVLASGTVAESPLRQRLLGYLDRRRQDLAQLREALGSGDFEEIQRIGHKLSRTGRSFGFPRLGEAADDLSSAAATRDAASVESALRRLADVVLGLQTSS
jgi:DNA-binding response OmpR family regulator